MHQEPRPKSKAAQLGVDAAYYRGQTVRRDLGYHYDRNLDQAAPLKPWERASLHRDR